MGLSGKVMVKISLALMMLIMGCAAPQPVQMQTKFDYDELKPYTKVGTNTIQGQGFLRQQGGGVVTCAGSDVLLVPATSYFREALIHVKTGKKPILITGLPPEYHSTIKRTTADAQGNFSFNAVPDGNWIVATAVKWTVGYASQGGELVREVYVAKGETKQVLLSEKDLIGR